MLELSSSQPASSSSPPTYEEATDPSFAQKMLAKTPWPGFHPAKLPRQMSRQLSRNSRPTEDGDTNQGQLLGGTPSGDDPCLDTFMTGLCCCFLCITGVLCFVIPVVMIAIGVFFYDQCSLDSPYPLWLIVGGGGVVAMFLFSILLMVTGTKNMGLYCILGLLLVFPLLWYVVGCWWLWGAFGHGRGQRDPEDFYLNYNNRWNWLEFLDSECAYPYWIAFWLVVTPLGLMALGLGIAILGGIICCFTTDIDDLEET